MEIYNCRINQPIENMSDNFANTLQSKAGYHPFLYVKIKASRFDIKSLISARKFVLSDWSDIKDGDEIFAVGEGMRYHGYIGRYNVNLKFEDWEEDPSMFHSQSYIPGKNCEIEYIGDVIQVVKDLNPKLYVDLLEHFGFEIEHDLYRLSDRVETLIDEHPEHFRELQIIHACLCKVYSEYN